MSASTDQATAVRPLGAVYDAARARMADLIRDAGPERAVTPVPACPSWTVRDVLAHVTGLYADIMSGILVGAGTDAWTAAQVERRRDAPVEDLLAESDDVGPKLAAMLDDFPGRYGSQVAADLAVHEQDIRGALGRPGARSSLTVDLALEFVFETIVGPGARALGLGPLEMRAGSRSWIVGTGEPPAGDPSEAIAAALASKDRHPFCHAAPVGRVSADPFELFRALTGRRSAAQVRRFDWTVDPEPYLAVFNLWPFTLRSTDLVE